MNMSSAVSYIFSKIGSIGQIFKGLSYFKTGGIGKSFGVVGQNSSHFDMRAGQETVYTGWSLMWIISAISNVLLNILNWIFVDFTISSIITMLIGLAISLAIYSFFISKGKQNESHWAAWAVKILIIIHLLSVLGYIGLICANVIGALVSLIGSLILLSPSYLIFSALGIALNFLMNVANIFLAFYILTGLNQAVPANMAYNNMNQGYNPNMQNGYNPNQDMSNGFNNVAGLGAINTQKNQSIGQDTTGFGNNQNMNNGYNPNNQGYGYNQQNNFNNQNNFNQNNFNPQEPQNVQYYACPYCGQAIVHGESPCHHCNNTVNWGM